MYQLFIYTFFLFQKTWGLGFLFFEIFHLLPFFIFAKKRSLPTLLKTGLALFLATYFWIRSGSGNSITVLTLFFLNPIIALEFVSGELFSLQVVLQTPKRMFLNLKQSIRSVSVVIDSILPFLNVKKVATSKYFDQVVIGSLLSVPILLILLSLFNDVDRQFIPSLWDNISRFIPDWIENFDLEHILPNIIEYTLFFLYLCFVFPVQTKENVFTLTKSFVIELITMNILVASLFFLFFSSQIQTFTQMISDFQQKQINPKLFVREGFYQLLFASFIGTGVSLLLNSQILSSITKKKKMVAIGAMTTLLLGVVLVSLLAGQRVFVYQYLHGLTVLRIWGMLLLVGFWVALSSLFLHIYQRIQFSWFLQIALFSFLIVVSIVQVMNIDYVVAKWGNPRVNDQTDWRYISKLSFDALPMWKAKLDHISPELLEKCRPSYLNEDINAPQFPDGFPNTDVAIVECQSVIEKFADEAELVKQLLVNANGFSINFSKDQNKRAEIRHYNLLLCDESKQVSWQSLNVSRQSGQKYLCEKQQAWESFYTEYTDLQVVLFYATHKQAG